MPLRIAINGLGRIGRLVVRTLIRQNLLKDIEIVAVNDLVSPENLAYLLKYDSTHGRESVTIDYDAEHLHIDGHKIRVYSEKDPAQLPWKKQSIDYVIEATGLFVTKEAANKHLEAGAKRVIITAPGKGDIPTFVMAVNEDKYNPKTDFIVSNASCTTNCLAPITKILLDNFGIEEGLMTTIHALTSSQATVDGPSKKDFRAGRGAFQNIIPASTGAAKAVGLCLPEVQGKITGMAFRVPVADVSVVDLTVRLTKATSYEEICQKIVENAEGNMSAILCYCDEQVVSSDFIGSTYSSIFDAKAGIELNNHFFKLVSWYDNEMGYATRIVDLVKYMAKQESN